MSTEQRIERLTSVLAEKRIDAFLVTTTSDIRWLTGFSRVFDEERAHLVIVSSDALETGDGLYLHTDMRYSGVMRARPDAGVWTIFDERMGHALYAAETLKGRFVPRMQSTAWQGGEPLRIGIEGDLPLNIWRALHEAFDEQFEGSGLAYELVELENLIVGLRAVKDADEYELLRAAQSVTDAGFTHMLDYLRPGLIEREAAVELEFFMRNNGADGLAFPSILASGPNTANPHAVPGDRMLQTGDFVLLDFGAKVDDYRSDMTRTIVLGSASERQREIYEAVLRAQTEAMASLRPGVAGPEPQALADAIFADRGFGALPHGLGHGVGIDIHESPNLSLKSKDVLVEGHVVTVEPGIYVNGYGGVRIEDYGVVTAEGFEDFTASPHELIEL